MKTLLLLGALGAGSAQLAAAQSLPVPAANLPADSLTQRILFKGVVAVPGVAAAELQARAREWVALTFQDARQVTQLDDAGRGVLIGRGYANTGVEPVGKRFLPPFPLSFTFRLDFRDGRYRYQVFDLGTPVTPEGPTFASPNSAPTVASRQAAELAAWVLGPTAAVAASPRQLLYQPDLAAFPASNDVTARYGSRWPDVSKAIYNTVGRLLDSLRQHETAPPARW